MSLAFQCIYGQSDEVKMRMGSEIYGGGESVDYLTCCMQMTWFCVVSWRKI